MIENLKRIRVMDSFRLKLLALVVMTIDHAAGAMRVMGLRGDWYLPMRGIGRVAFPVYCFLLAEGFFYTRSRWKYLARILLLFLLSEPIYDLTLRGEFPDWSNQNVLLTLALGLGTVWLMNALGNRLVRRDRRLAVLKLAACLPGLWLAELLNADYGYGGVLLVVVCYVLRSWPVCMCLAGFLVLYYAVGSFEVWALFAALPILLYSGTRGRVLEGPGVKYAFYLYYPLHLAAILLVLRVYFPP